MYKLFEYFYSYDGLGVYHSIAFLYIIVAAITTILFIAFLVFAIKTKKKDYIITSVLLFLVSYPALTPFFEQRAVYKSVGVRMFDVKGLQAANCARCNNSYNNDYLEIFDKNKDEYIKNLEIAAKLSLFPSQKGFIYLEIAKEYAFKDFQTKKRYFDKAYKDLGSYKSRAWLIPMLDYYAFGDFDKVIEIAEVHKGYGIIAKCYIMKGDYNKALVMINKAVDQKPNSPWMLSTRANIYRNLGDSYNASKDYQVALKNSQGFTQKDKTLWANRYKYKDSIKQEWKELRKRSLASLY